ncbi:MAG: hypothetical protein AB7F59_14715 [Bdellovibrionales bacterium]
MATIEKLGKVTTQSVLKGTGKSWDQWIALLNKAGAQTWEHKQIVQYLKNKYKLSLWWQQGVTGGYEIHLGRRVEGQNLKGEYNVTVTKSFPLNAKKTWELLASPEGLRVWLGVDSSFNFEAKKSYETDDGVFGEVRTMKKGLRARLSWQEDTWPKPSILQLYVAPQGKEKCIIIFQHDQLREGRLRIKLREHWKKVLTRLCELV